MSKIVDASPINLPKRNPYPNGKQFDTRLLDQLECLCGEYRYWHSDKVNDLPVGYRIEQREAIRVRLRESAIRAARALDGR